MNNIVKGIFSLQTKGRIGAGTTSKKIINLTYWLAKGEEEEGLVILHSLDKKFNPCSPSIRVSKKELFSSYCLEPKIWYELVNKRISYGDLYRQQKKNIQAEIEYKNAIKIDEDNIKANFGLGLVYLEMSYKEKACYVFEKLIDIDETFEQEHKHLFNDFGISLRKKKLFEQALRFYYRALELSGWDDHLYFNIARANYERGDIDYTYEALFKIFEQNPEQKQGRQMLEYLVKNNILPKNRTRLQQAKKYLLNDSYYML